MPQDQGSALLSLVGGILLFVLVLFLAWFCIRWLGKRYRAPRPGGSIEVLEQAAIGPERSLAIVRVKEKVWLLGVTAQHIAPIGELNPEEFPPPEQTQGPAAPHSGVKDFSKTLQEALRSWIPEKKQKKEKQDE